MDDQPTVVNHHAILIGINSYPEKPLKGCVQDVQNIKEYLEQEVSSVNIQIFTAPESVHSDAPSQHEDPMLRPTYENVTSALRNKTSKAKPGDYVYIHFSGHGTRARGVPDSEFSNKLTGDLALVLLDGRDESKVRCFQGPTLTHYYLNPMVQKGLVVTLVLDCCFAASVYRRDDAGVRFLPYDANADSIFRRDDLGFEKTLESGSGTRAMRDASMRPNWLMEPDGYAILAACGPDEEEREINLEGGNIYGVLSYFLRKSFGGPGGCREKHDTIYQRLRAILLSHSVQQHPVLYGNKDQGFFGHVDFKSNESLIQVIEKLDGNLQLLAGQAHGFCNGDRFALYTSVCDPRSGSRDVVVNATIAHAGALTSGLKAPDLMLGRGQRVWTAMILNQSSLQAYPIQLGPNLPDRDGWTTALTERSLAIHNEGLQSSFFLLSLNKEENYEIRDTLGQQVINLPTMTQNQTDINQVVHILEHLVKFQLVKNLTNIVPNNSFRTCFNVRINNCDPENTVEVKHGKTVELVLENLGQKWLYFFVYDLGPSWQVQNLLHASWLEVRPRQDGQRSTRKSKSIEMTVPDGMTKRGVQQCDDFIKIFVTSQPTLFNSLELPKLGEAAERKSTSRVDEQDGNHTLEDWAALNFHIRVSFS